MKEDEYFSESFSAKRLAKIGIGEAALEQSKMKQNGQLMNFKSYRGSLSNATFGSGKKSH